MERAYTLKDATVHQNVPATLEGDRFEIRRTL